MSTEEISSLVNLFPQWDRTTLKDILNNVGNDLDLAIEQILMMNIDTDKSSGNTTGPNSLDSNSDKNRRNAFRIGDDSDDEEIDLDIKRGTEMELPDDFLRVPGSTHTILADEEIAAMLQNEWFQQEAREVLNRQPNRKITAGQDLQPKKSEHEEFSLSSMSATAKRKLSMLAHRFMHRDRHNSGETSSFLSRNDNFKPLVNQDEEDAEIITFNEDSTARGTPKGHFLQTGLASQERRNSISSPPTTPRPASKSFSIEEQTNPMFLNKN